MTLRKIFLSVLVTCSLAACKKDYGPLGPTTDSRPDVPVTVANVYDYRPAPTVKASKAENKIVVTLQIPSGRTIKEVTKIAASTTANFTAIYSGTVVGTGTTQLWSSTPIPVNATTYTFTTTFDEYKLKTGVTAVPASNTLLGRDFYFLLTLDNDQTVIPQNIRVWVVD